MICKIHIVSPPRFVSSLQVFERKIFVISTESASGEISVNHRQRLLSASGGSKWRFHSIIYSQILIFRTVIVSSRNETIYIMIMVRGDTNHGEKTYGDFSSKTRSKRRCCRWLWWDSRRHGNDDWNIIFKWLQHAALGIGAKILLWGTNKRL